MSVKNRFVDEVVLEARGNQLVPEKAENEKKKERGTES